ncbi:MAG: DNA adenine methylase [Pseudomonadota bacterium]
MFTGGVKQTSGKDAVHMGYLGAKSGSGVYQAIINLMPPHDTYVELFLGSGAVMQRKPASAHSIGIDRSEAVIDQFECHYPVETVCADWEDWLAGFEPSGRTLIYCDPPYVHATRTSKARYEYEFDIDDHKRLLRVLQEECREFDIILSGYRNPLYEEMIADWWSMDFQAMTHGGVRTETIWTNFKPGAVHYHTYAGQNFTDRQRIKRKAQRWASNYSQLPPGEQQAVLAAILTADSSPE